MAVAFRPAFASVAVGVGSSLSIRVKLGRTAAPGEGDRLCPDRLAIGVGNNSVIGSPVAAMGAVDAEPVRVVEVDRVRAVAASRAATLGSIRSPLDPR